MVMQQLLEGALDELISPRSTIASQKDGLAVIERILAEILLTEKRPLGENDLETFLKLQDSFQCNIASRIYPWLAYRTEALKKPGDQGSYSPNGCDDGIGSTTPLVIQGLSLLQGVALLHSPSKEFLCRKSSIEVFVDLLYVCRQATAKPFANSTNTSPTKPSSSSRSWDISLASAALDTLLCVLVDSPTALRCFEEARGIEHVVKILKRSAIPKDVRIKCLEFLYFYLMDESPRNPTFSSDEIPTRPSSPAKTLKTTVFDRSRVSTTSSWSSNSSRSQSSTSWSPTPTLAGTPPLSPKKVPRSELPPVHDSLAMLRKDVDFVPLSPKRGKVAQINGANRRPRISQQHTPSLKVPHVNSGSKYSQLSPLSRLASEETLLSESDTDSSVGDDRKVTLDNGGADGRLRKKSTSSRTRTIEEKKEILGQLLGNVDALVEGVKKAGIWG